MKPITSLLTPIDPVQFFSASKKKHSHVTKIKRQKQVVPPDEEYCSRLNAIAQQYPFCIYYKEKNNDPL
jgi:hypothetical protein